MSGQLVVVPCRGVDPQQLHHQVVGHVLRDIAALRLGAGDGHFFFFSLHSGNPHN